MRGALLSLAITLATVGATAPPSGIARATDVAGTTTSAPSTSDHAVVAVIAPKTGAVGAIDRADDGGSSGAIVLVLVGVVAAGVAWGLVRRRPRREP